MTGRVRASSRADGTSTATRAAIGPLGYQPALDGVRAIAVLMVMFAHFAVPGWEGGVLGVDVFFVLSGFLITTLLAQEYERTGRIRLGRFYVRRALRLFPALFVLLAVTAPFVARIWTLTALLYVSNWALAFGFVGIGPISHLWSLSVEEQFYLVWPILLFALLRLRALRAAVVALVGVLAAASAAFKILGWTSPGSWNRLYHGSDACAEGLLVGCGLALLLAWNMLPDRRAFRRWIAAASVLALTVFAVLVGTMRLQSMALYRFGGMSLMSWSVGIMLLRLMTDAPGPVNAVLTWKPLVGIGRISYGLYLWHHPIAWLPNPWIFGPLAPVPHFIVRLVLTFAATLASWFAIEQPMLRLKERWARVPA